MLQKNVQNRLQFFDIHHIIQVSEWQAQVQSYAKKKHEV